MKFIEMDEATICVWLCVLLMPVFVALVRLLVVLPLNRKVSTSKFSLSEVDGVNGKTMMVLLGSGGHTGEMMRILANVNLANLNRIWVTSTGDSTSVLKARDYENQLESKFMPQYVQLHRARKVGESILSSALNSVKSLVMTVPLLLSLPQFPDVLLVNGPGTCVPLAYILFVLKFLGIANTKIIYIESLARVDHLSLSGKLIFPIADRFVVQWEQLQYKYHRAEYYGILI